MMDDPWDDRQLAAALRRRAEALDVGDLGAAATTVRRRAGRQRKVRIGASVLSVAVLGAAGVVAFRSIDSGQDVVRTPATEPPVVTTLPPAPTVPTTTVPTTTVPTAPSVTVVTTVPPTSAQPGEYHSLGGSITVQQLGDTIQLLGEPEPADGYSVEVEDDGPDRVRVRFERGELRSRITVELVDGAPVPQIEEE
jgi:hypothetical protein